jgi:predicted secreted acid phosphatase
VIHPLRRLVWRPPLQSPLALLILLLALPLPAQSTPPTCPGDEPAATKSIRPGIARPTTDALEAIAASAAADPTFIIPAEPLPNFGIERLRLADYADCVGTTGCYWADLEAQIQRAEIQLDRIATIHKATNPQEKLAIVLDIDETSLSSYCEEKHEDYGYIRTMFETWIVSPEASIPIPGTLRLFNRARSLGIEVFFITGRTGANGISLNGNPVTDQTAATARNLTAAGYKGWTRLILRNQSEIGIPTTTYKAAERAKIVADGYRIILNMGDQWSDLNGDPKAEVSVKLPNPFYYLP